jgi:hypothetical protein
MVGGSFLLAFVLAAVGTSGVAAEVFPRQTTFSNTTVSSTTTSADAGIPTPPPCCWILAGTHAVGLNQWYTSTAEHVVGELIVFFPVFSSLLSCCPGLVLSNFCSYQNSPRAGDILIRSPATVITTYIRENNGSAVPANSTTIYANTTGYPVAGEYQPIDMVTATYPWVTIPGVPSTLLPDSYRWNDYAATAVDNVTAMTFPGTDLVIHQPTPYDEWFLIAVYTTTPDTSLYPSSTGLTAWPPNMCGSYLPSTQYGTITQTITSNGGVSTVISAVPTGTTSRLVPSGKSDIFFYTAALFGAADRLDVTYRSPKATQTDAVTAFFSFPTGLVDWLGKQENVIAKYPYITDCWAEDGGQGQPTVHVPVNALTVTSSHIIDVQKAPSPTTSPSAVKPTESAHTEIEETTIDQPPSPSPTTSPSAVKPTESAHTEIEGTTLDQPPPSDTITILDPPSATTTASAPHTENQGSSLDLPSPPPSPSGTKQTRETRLTIPGMTAHTEIEHTTVDGPKSTDSRMPKAHTEISAPVLDVPTRSYTNRPGSALPAQGSDAASGKESSASRPGGGIVVAGSDDNDDNDSKQQPSQGGSSGGNNNNEQDNGIGGLISAIQSVASQQTRGSSDSQGHYNQQDVSARPAAAATDNDSGPRPSITGFVVGSQTLTPGGAALTQGGSTFTALPSGSGLQVVAQSSTLRLDGVVPPGMFTVPGVVQKPDSEDEYLVGNAAVSAGGPAVTIGRETFSALPSGSGVQVVNGDGQTRTESVVAVATIDSSPVRSGENDGQYVFGGNTLSAGGQALTIDGTTFSALPSRSGIAVVNQGQTSTASLGGTVDFLTVTGASVTAFATPVLLPGGDNHGDDSHQQLVTLGGSTYTALATDGSLLVIDGQTVNPGETTVIHGETVVLSGTSLVVVTATSTHGLGDAIMSGLGGGSSSSSSSGDDEEETASSSSGPDAEETSASNDGGSGDSTTGESAAVPGAQVAFVCLVASAVFALALM